MTVRCAWAEGDPVMAAYHDAEWGVPVRDGRMLWEMLMLEGFQAGLSWRTILYRREGFRRAFAGFDPAKVAAFDDADVERLMADEGIIRARAKIEATIAAAKIYQQMQSDGENFSDWVWGLAGGETVIHDGLHILAKTPESEAMSKALKARGFKFVGPVIVYAWMQAVGMVNDHAPDCFRRNAV
ncbi:DNA-3-methyladenine glycosylase I [Sphingomonas sp. AOB5]|uniref:DNA-3-methyladenine glycosylase I n=1 Tax=Sphingomonas sp. AOB5 TaxID=3034017 RepID=UPI0023F9319B|nr:DNA-3-methyladenine glycosylase I [Sphingomonas sp. AOB5]MDF7774145.1 DNA-3-methyladenine glycosylase I [Sphingomonas sp. AOB5]